MSEPLTQLAQRLSILEARVSGIALELENLKNGYISSTRRQSKLQQMLKEIQNYAMDVDEDVRRPKSFSVEDICTKALEKVTLGQRGSVSERKAESY